MANLLEDYNGGSRLHVDEVRRRASVSHARSLYRRKIDKRFEGRRKRVETIRLGVVLIGGLFIASSFPPLLMELLH